MAAGKLRVVIPSHVDATRQSHKSTSKPLHDVSYRTTTQTSRAATYKTYRIDHAMQANQASTTSTAAAISRQGLEVFSCMRHNIQTAEACVTTGKLDLSWT